MGRPTVAAEDASAGREAYEAWTARWSRRFRRHMPGISDEAFEDNLKHLLTQHAAWAPLDDRMTAYALSISAIAADELETHRRRLQAHGVRS
jgi:hypothetical protein